MKKIALACAVALSLSGCASTTTPGSWATGINSGLNNFFVGVNSIAATMKSPAGQEAIANLKSAYQGTICGIATTSALIDQIAVAVNAKKAVTNSVTIVVAVSSTACKGAGGVVGS